MGNRRVGASASALRPWVPGDQERDCILGNPDVTPIGMEFLRRFDLVGDLAAVDCPPLVCVGEIDPVTPVAAAREIVDVMPDVKARLEVITGAGHFFWKDEADRFWPVIREFVGSAAMAP